MASTQAKGVVLALTVVCAAAGGETGNSPLAVVMGPVEAVAATPDERAPAIAVQEDLPRRLRAAAKGNATVVTYRTFQRAALTLRDSPSVTSWPAARAAAEELGYDRVVLVEVQCSGRAISGRWQIYDSATGQGTVAAGTLPGHIVDLDGFVASLARRIGSALGCLEPAGLSAAVRGSATLSDAAYRDYYIGRALLEAGDPTRAAEHFARALADDPAFSEARSYLAAARATEMLNTVYNSNYPIEDGTIESLLGDLLHTPFHAVTASVAGMRAKALRARGQVADAEAAELECARLLLRIGDPRTALQKLSELRGSGSASYELPLLEAAALRATGDWRGAEDVLKAAQAAQPTRTDIMVALAELYTAYARDVAASRPDADGECIRWYSHARSVLSKAVAMGAREATTLLALGEATLGAGDADRALDSATSLLDPRRPVQLTAEQRARCLVVLGWAEAKSGRQEAAARHLAETRSLVASLDDDDWGPATLPTAPVKPPGYRADLVLAWAEAGRVGEASVCLRHLRLLYGRFDGIERLEETMAQR